VETITRGELKEKLDRGDDLVVVDVLDGPYYRRSHLPGAINLPLECIGEAEDVLPNKSADIVVYRMSTM
jgi:rhodanese-related sulfurtransferase